MSRFLFEAKTTARFNHPHIVTIYGVGQVQGMPYVALEYLEGQDLRTRIQSQPPGQHEALRIMLAVSEAIEEAHKHDILHRDLKPANVLMPIDGRVRVVDFGLAMAVQEQPATASTVVDDGEMPFHVTAKNKVFPAQEPGGPLAMELGMPPNFSRYSSRARCPDILRK